MVSLVPPRHIKTATTARRNVVERSNQISIARLVKIYKSRAMTPDINPTESLQFALQNKISALVLVSHFVKGVNRIDLKHLEMTTDTLMMRSSKKNQY